MSRISVERSLVGGAEFWTDIRIEISETGYEEYDRTFLHGSLLTILDSREEWVMLPSEQKLILVSTMETALQDCGFVGGGRDELHANVIIESIIVWMNNCLPLGEACFESGKLQLLGIWLLWGFYVDTILDVEDIQTFPGGHDIIRSFNIVSLDIFEGKYGKDIQDSNFPVNKNMPFYVPLCRLAKLVYANLSLVFPDKSLGRYSNRLLKHFTKVMSSFEMKFSGECYSSEGNFRACHWDSSGMLWCLSMAEFVGKDCVAPEWLEYDSVYVRLQSLLLRICEMGDIIGIRKDLKTKDEDNLIIMKVKGGEFSLKAAWNSMVQLFNTNTRDYLRLTEFLRKKYAGEMVCCRHVAAMDLLMAGTLRWASLSKRYRLDKPECITISYREEQQQTCA
jgi:hypothetical protein